MNRSIFKTLVLGAFLILGISSAHAGGGGGSFLPACEADGSKPCKFADYSTEAYSNKLESLQAHFCQTGDPAIACDAAQKHCEASIAEDIQANCSSQASDLDSNGNVVTQYYFCQGDTFSFFFDSTKGKYATFLSGMLQDASYCPVPVAKTDSASVDHACYDPMGLSCYQNKEACEQGQGGDPMCQEKLKSCLDEAAKSCPIKTKEIGSAAAKPVSVNGSGCSMNPASPNLSQDFSTYLLAFGIFLIPALRTMKKQGFNE